MCSTNRRRCCNRGSEVNDSSSRRSAANYTGTYTLFGNLNHFGQNLLYLVPKQKKREKKEEHYISEMRYLKRTMFKTGQSCH